MGKKYSKPKRVLPPDLEASESDREKSRKPRSPSWKPMAPQPKARPVNSTTVALTPEFSKEAMRFFKSRDYAVDSQGLIADPVPISCYEGSQWPRIFVLSLFDGIGGAFEVLHNMPVMFEGFAAEKDPVLRHFVGRKWPQISVLTSAEQCTSDWLRDNVPVDDDAVAAVLLLAGPPCQPFASLGAQRGFADNRSKSIETFREVRDDLACLCAGLKPFHWLMEESGTLQQEDRAQISNMLGEVPIAVQAADWGWTHRLRLWWGVSAYLPQVTPFAEVHPPHTLTPDTFVLRWLGARVPTEWTPHDSDRVYFGDCEMALLPKPGRSAPRLPGSPWSPVYEDGRFFTFTECWPDHAADTHPKPDKAMLRAFDADKRRAPLYQYQSSNLLWHPADLEDLEAIWRSRDPPFGVPLTADDKEILMGYSYRYTEELDEAMQLGAEDEECSMAKPSREEVETRRRHAIGQGWHIPSVTLLLTLLLAQILPAEGVAS